VSKESENSGGNGPSWWDVERLLQELSTRYNVSVLVTTTCSRDKSSGRCSWWVRSEAHPLKRLCEPAIAVGAHGFRGNGGASTYPTALYLALGRLGVALDELDQPQPR
jgi:hypothetical protein